MKKRKLYKTGEQKPFLEETLLNQKMEITGTKLYKPLINREKQIKHSVQQSVNLIRVGVRKQTATFQSNTAKSLI